MNWELIKPWAAQAARDGLRTVGAGLAAHGYIHNGADTEAFVGAGMTLAGLFWGWFTTGGAQQMAGLLKKLTATATHADAVKAAEVLPPSAAVDTALNKAAVQSVIAKVLIVAFACSMLLSFPSAMAQQPKLTGNIVKDIEAAKSGQPLSIGGQKLTGSAVTDVQNFMNAKFLPDLQYALKLATASKNTITADCYQAWIDIITTQQNAVMDSQTPPQALPMPDPHVITEFEKLVELRNALQPESPFMVKCSPVASMIKLDIAKFMGVVISGGAGLATLVPGL